MKKYKAVFSNTKIQVRDKDGTEPNAKDLGHITFFHFDDGKTNKLSKAFMMATGPQQDADRVEITEIK